MADIFSNTGGQAGAVGRDQPQVNRWTGLQFDFECLGKDVGELPMVSVVTQPQCRSCQLLERGREERTGDN